MNKITALIFLIISTLSLRLSGQEGYEGLAQDLLESYEKSNLTGFAVSIVNADSTIYKEAFGFENIETKNHFSLDKRFYVASISKTFIGISLMKLVEENKLELTTPINSILPFQVVNPHIKDSQITIEHLARHTSSILNGNVESSAWYLDEEFELGKKEVGKTPYNDFTKWNKNSSMELGVFLKESLTPQGKFYSTKNFSKNKPGLKYEYSNLGAALAAYIVELKTGVSFDTYIENFITEELSFKPGVWRHIQENILPTSYFQTKVKTPRHRPILYPTGGMLLSCNELTIYLKEMIRGYSGNSPLLNLNSFRTMMSKHDEESGENGIFWELNGDKVGHNGGNYGTICFMSFDKTTGIGKIFMTNISSYKNGDLLQEMIAIWRKLGEFETKL